MSAIARRIVASTALMLALVAAPAASAATTTPSPQLPPAPVAPPAPVPPPAPPPPGAGPVPGRASLALLRVGGSPPFAFVKQRIAMQGSVRPYVAGQMVSVNISRDGHRVVAEQLPVKAGANGLGSFRVTYTSSASGLVTVRVVHYATSQQAQFSANAPSVRYVQVNLGPGARGASVRLLQSELNVLHYAVPLSGVFDEGTGRALIAYRKMTGLERTAYAGTRVFERLARGDGAFRVRYPRDGRHVEGDLTRQVLAEIDPRGRVRLIYMMSSGKPSTPTVIGRFRVYMKTPGVNSEGMVDSNYFIRGYAIHGYPEVPTYAASHGCLRIPIPDAPAVFGWVHEGTPVDVYNEGGGGSVNVRHNAGP